MKLMIKRLEERAEAVVKDCEEKVTRILKEEELDLKEIEDHHQLARQLLKKNSEDLIGIVKRTVERQLAKLQKHHDQTLETYAKSRIVGFDD